VSSPPPPGVSLPPPSIEPSRRPGGCARGSLVGCGVAGLLVLILLALFLAYVRRKPETVTDLMMGQIERNLAPDVTSEEKERLKAAYASFRSSLRQRRASPEPVDRMRTILSEATRGPIARGQVRELTAALEGGSAASAPPAGATAVPIPTPAPSPAP
jgi:hypothetical protein